MPLLPPIASSMNFEPVASADGINENPEPRPVPAVPLSETFKAGWKRDNDIYNTMKWLDRETNYGEPDFDFLGSMYQNHIQGTDLETHADSFTGVRNQKEFDALAARIREERQTTSILEASNPAAAFLASGVASIVSPTTLIPVYGVARSVKVGATAARTALAAGATNAAAAGIQEGILHATQATRTQGETAMAMGGSFVLAGILGGAAGGLSAAKFKKLSTALEDLQVEANINRDYARQAYELSMRQEARSAGAAAIERPDAELKGALGLEKTVSQATPWGRTMNSAYPAGREMEVMNVEAPGSLTRNREGYSTAPIGGSIETRTKTQGVAPLGQSLKELERIYLDYRFGDPNTKLPGYKNLVSPDKTKMSDRDFYMEVGKAASRMDEHDNPFVAKAAKVFREKLIEPVAANAVRERLLNPELVRKGRPSTAATVTDRVKKLEEWAGPKTTPAQRKPVDDLLNQMEEFSGVKFDKNVRDFIVDRIANNQENLDRLRKAFYGNEDVPFALRDVRGQHIRRVMDDLEDGYPYVQDRAVVDRVEAIAKDVRLSLPEAVRDVPINVMVGVQPKAGDMVEISFRGIDGGFRTVDMTRAEFGSARAFSIDGGVFLTRTDLVGDVSQMVGGEVRHELVHALFSTERITPLLAQTLLDHAGSLRVLDMPLRDYLQKVGDDAWEQASVEPVRDVYTKQYSKMSEASQSEALGQEAIAHMVELRHHGALTDEQLAPILDDLDNLFGKPSPVGETQKRIVGEWIADLGYAVKAEADGSIKFALRGSDIDVGRSMRADLDRLGYFSGALEAAKRLRQAKGTPEQMLAMLQKEGAKKAEIEATGLAQLFEGKARKLESAPDGTRIRDVSVSDHYKGESFGEKVMERDGKPIAVIDLSVTSDLVWIRNIESIDRKKGHATALVDDLFREFPDRKIIISDMTEDGAKFFRNKYDLLPEGEIKPKTAQITKTEIIKFLEDNRVEVREAKYGGTYPMYTIEDVAKRLRERSDQYTGADRNEMLRVADQIERDGFDGSEDLTQYYNSLTEYGSVRDEIAEIEDALVREPGPHRPAGMKGEAKWSSYSLYPSNPTYREIVLHLPAKQVPPQIVVEPGRAGEGYWDATVRAWSSSGWVSESKSGLRSEAEARTWAEQAAAKIDAQSSLDQTATFRSGHFPEPNIVGHMMTSMVKHEGKATYLIDQIQSDWGQKLRDGGVRDEAKIAELKSKIDEAKAKHPDQWLVNAFQERRMFDTREAAEKWILDKAPKAKGLFAKQPEIRDGALYVPGTGRIDIRAIQTEHSEVQRLRAELATAETATPGHPLVNTTDQWVNTTLRRAIRQAAEADAEYIAVPSGDTVLSYNPGDADGMRGFYGATKMVDREALQEAEDIVDLTNADYRKAIEDQTQVQRRNAEQTTPNSAKELRAAREAVQAAEDAWTAARKDLERLRKMSDRLIDGIVPKNLKNILRKIDKSSPDPVVVDKLDTPGSGMKGEGFTLFPLTDKVKQTVKEQGQPLFAMRGLDMSPEARKARAEEMGFDTSRVWYHGTTKEFDAFDPAKANRAGGVARAFYLTPSTDLANYFSRPSLDGSRVIPVYIKRDINLFDYRNEGHIGALVKFLQSKTSQQIMPGYLGAPDPKSFIDDAKLGSAGLLELPVVQKWLRRKGFAGWYSTEGVNQTPTLALLNPSDVRSVNAAFDPAKADSPNLMFALRDLSRRLDAPLVDDLAKTEPHPGRVMAVHGTKAQPFDQFDPAKSADFGIHFGTRDQADIPAGYTTTRENARMIPVVLDLKTVVDVPDMMTWPPVEVAAAVEKAYPLARGLEDRVRAVIAAGSTETGPTGSTRPSREALAAGKAELRRLMTEAKIDGLRYWNDSEGEGWSYIVWDEGKVSSATSGEPMMGVKPDGQPLFALRGNGEDILKKIRELGGIKDETGDLANMGAGERKGIINNETGLSPDAMRAHMVEQGYLDDVPYEDVTQSSVNDLYDMVSEALSDQGGRGRAYREEMAFQAIRAVQKIIDDNGLEIKLTPEQEDALVKMILDRRMSPDDALERMQMAGADDEPRAGANNADPLRYTNTRREMEALKEAVEAQYKMGHDPMEGQYFNDEIGDEVWGGTPGQSYIMRLYNHEKIIRRRTQFRSILADYFEQSQQRAASALRRMERDVADAKARSMQSGREYKMSQNAEKDLTDLRAFVDHSRKELEDIADGVIDNILGRPDLLTFDLPESLRGALKSRTLRIPDAFESANGKFEDFLDRDVRAVGRAYVHSVVVDTEIMRMHGSLNMEEWPIYQKMVDEYHALVNNPELAKLPPAKAEKIRAGLEKDFRRTTRDLKAQIDRMRGVYKLPDDPTSWGPRTIRIIKELNLLRMLGGMTISALPDIGRVMMVHGFTDTVRYGIRPLFGHLRAVKLAGEEVQLSGTALDMILGSRIQAIADVLDNYGRYSKGERGLGWLAEKFGYLTLMNQWNSGIKQWVGAVTMTKIIKACKRVADGTATKADIDKLAASSIIDKATIDTFAARKIAEQFDKHGMVEGGLHIPNTEAWDVSDPNVRLARDALRGAIVRDVDNIIVTPGQEKPLWFSTQMGSVILQFKSFAASSMEKTLIAGLQQRDAGVFMGASMMIAFGVAVEWLKALTNDKPLPANNAQWVAAAIDRSGLLGWFADVNNISEKMTRGTVGVSALTGRELSRFASRNVVDALAGPTFGTIGDMTVASGGLFSSLLGGEQVRQSDLAAVRRLIPLQNLFYLSNIFQQLEKSAGKSLGAKRSKSRSPLMERLSSNQPGWLDEFVNVA